MVNFQRKERYDWEDLLTIMRILRAPGGCPWDREQTHQSIRRNFLEETYEALDAIDRDSAPDMQEELGDVLLQVVFHAAMEEERGRFTPDDVVDGVAQKLVFRHAHVFGSAQAAADSAEALEDWEAQKKQEKGYTSVETGGAVDAPHGVREELGDALFALCKIAQMSGVDPEDALHRACDKYQSRFRTVADTADKPLSDYTEAELVALWEQAKK